MTVNRMLAAGLPVLFGAVLGLGTPAEAGRASKTKTQITGQVNLNTATAQQLRLLPRLRPKTAEAIVAYRTQHRFQSVREVMQVKGVGQASFLRMKPHLAVEGPNTLVRVKRAMPKGRAKIKGTKASKAPKIKKAKKAKKSKVSGKAKKAGKAKARKASAAKRRAKACATAARRAEKCQEAGRATAACKRAERKVRACQRAEARRAAQGDAPQAKRSASGDAPGARAKRSRRPKTAAQKAAACQRVLRTVKRCDAEGRTNPGCVIARSKAKSCARSAAAASTGAAATSTGAPAPRQVATPKDRAESPAPKAKGTRG